MAINATVDETDPLLDKHNRTISKSTSQLASSAHASAPSKASTLSTLPSPPATYFVRSTYPGSSHSIFYSALLPLSSSKKLLEFYWHWRIFLAFSSQWVISSARDLQFALRSVLSLKIYTSTMERLSGLAIICCFLLVVGVVRCKTVKRDAKQETECETNS